MSLDHLITRVYGYADALGSEMAIFFHGTQTKLPNQISILEVLEQVNLPQLFLIHVLLSGYLTVKLAQWIRTHAYVHHLP